MAGHSDVDGMRDLGREAVVSKGRDETDDCARNSDRDRYEIRASEFGFRSKSIEASANLLDFTGIP